MADSKENYWLDLQSERVKILCRYAVRVISSGHFGCGLYIQSDHIVSQTITFLFWITVVLFSKLVSIVVYLYSNKWLHLYLNTYHASFSVYYCKFQKYFLKSSTGMLQGWSQVCWSSRIFWIRKFDFQVFHQIDILVYSHFDEHNSW